MITNKSTKLSTQLSLIQSTWAQYCPITHALKKVNEKLRKAFRKKGIRDAGSTADFRILFKIFEILEIFDFFETFKFFGNF